MYPVIHLKETYVFFSGGTTLALERYLRMPKRKKNHKKNMHYMVAVEACALTLDLGLSPALPLRWLLTLAN